METKICTHCGIEKSVELFAYRNKAKGTRRAECKECISNRQKERYYDKKNIVNKIKTDMTCQKCGEKRFYLLDFHHLNPSTKRDTVARLSAFSNEQAMMDEIKKCICLCANCHREFHYLEKEQNITLDKYLNI